MQIKYIQLLHKPSRVFHTNACFERYIKKEHQKLKKMKGELCK